MTEISTALAELINIRYTADCHKRDCNNSDCNVSLFQLRKVAERLCDLVPREEYHEAMKYLIGWPS